MARSKLNTRQVKFISALMSGLGKRDAALSAGYSPHTAANIASNLLSQEHVLRALRDAAEKKLHAGAAIGVNVLLELAEKARSEDVRLRAAAALLAHSGLAPVTRHETKHILEDRRSDAELLQHVKTLASQLGVKLPSNVVDATFEEIPKPALPKPESEPVAYATIFDDAD